jgi:hypothetical protein
MTVAPAWELSVISTDYIPVFVKATLHGVPYNPSRDPVEFAFIVGDGDPGPADWHTASWDTVGSSRWVAQCLVGPGTGAVLLPVGTYNVWVRVVDNPAIPTRSVGELVIN